VGTVRNLFDFATIQELVIHLTLFLRPRYLFVTQRFDWIETGCFNGGIYPKEETNAH
jgi:hypothetical protein